MHELQRCDLLAEQPDEERRNEEGDEWLEVRAQVEPAGALTDAIVEVIGERVRAGLMVELVGTPAGRTGIGGVVVSS
jgi:hypothetical protein